MRSIRLSIRRSAACACWAVPSPGNPTILRFNRLGTTHHSRPAHRPYAADLPPSSHLCRAQRPESPGPPALFPRCSPSTFRPSDRPPHSACLNASTAKPPCCDGAVRPPDCQMPQPRAAQGRVLRAPFPLSPPFAALFQGMLRPKNPNSGRSTAFPQAETPEDARCPGLSPSNVKTLPLNSLSAPTAAQRWRERRTGV
jgi:hypothetical protein